MWAKIRLYPRAFAALLTPRICSVAKGFEILPTTRAITIVCLLRKPTPRRFGT